MNTRLLIAATASAGLMLMAGQALAADKSVRITTQSTPLTAKCIFPVQVVAIDGNEVEKPSLAFNIEPGMHSLKFKSQVDRRYCGQDIVSRNSRDTVIPPLEMEFEAGKTYHVALDASADDDEDWRVVVRNETLAAD